MSEIVLNDPKTIAEFIDFVFHELEVSHLLWNGKSWYPWDTYYRTRPKNLEFRDWDPDHVCYGYWNHKWNKDDDSDDESVEDPPGIQKVKNIEDFRHVFEFIGEETFKGATEIVLPRDITVINDFGCINADHRGSNHMWIDIDGVFDGTVEISAGKYSISDLANLIWRVKGNKFDNQYEAVFHFIYECEDNNDYENYITLEDEKWYVNLKMDHGS